MVVIDIVLSVIILIFVIIGFSKGLLKSIISLFGNLFCIIISFLLAKPLATFLQNTFGMASSIGGQLVNSVSSTIPTFTDPMEGSAVLEQMNDPSLITTLIKKFIDPTVTYASSDELLTVIGDSLGALASIAISIIIAFIVIKIVILLLSKLFDAITKQRAINGMDRLLGGVFGLIKVAVFIVVAMSILYILSPIIPTTWMDGTVVFKFCYNYSIEILNFVLDKINVGNWVNGIVSAII